MRKNWGFIAAPLLGTLIFLAAVLFVVHVTQVDKSEVARLTNSAYQDKVSTDLEDFRSDMGTLFAVSIARGIEKWLTQSCWSAFDLENYPQTNPPSDANTVSDVPEGLNNSVNPSFTADYDDLDFCQNVKTASVTYSPDGVPNTCKPNTANAAISPICKEQCNHELDYYELRYQKCTALSNFMRNGVCAINSQYGVPGWISAILAGSGGGGICTFSGGCIATGTNFTLPQGADPTQSGQCSPAQTGCTCTPGSSSLPTCPSSTGTYSPSSQNIFNFEGVSFSVPNANQAQGLTAQAQCIFTDTSTGSTISYVVNDPGMYTVTGSTCLGLNTCVCTPSTCSIVSGNPPNAFSISCSNQPGAFATSLQSTSLCNQLIGNSLFDCRNFAEKTNSGDCGSTSIDNNSQCPFRCCSKYAQFDFHNPSAAYNVYAGTCCADSNIPAGDLSSLGCDAYSPPSPNPNKKYLLAGCEGGSFMVQLNTTASNQLYQSIPRAQATDASGNVLSASALTDKLAYIPIQYPLYKYLDTAFKVYAPIAYGVTGNFVTDFISPQPNMKLFTPLLSSKKLDEGVVQGWCDGPACNYVSYSPYVLSNPLSARTDFGPSTQSAGLPSMPFSSNPTAAAEKSFVDTFLNPINPLTNQQSTTSICRLFQHPNCDSLGLCNIELWIGWGSNPLEELCPNENQSLFVNVNCNPNGVGCTPASSLYNPAALFSASGNSLCGQPGNQPLQCAYITNLVLTVEFRDKSAQSLVSTEYTEPSGAGTAPYNPYCWGLTPWVFQPCAINPATGACR